jgi:hypothetical protein
MLAYPTSDESNLLQVLMGLGCGMAAITGETRSHSADAAAQVEVLRLVGNVSRTLNQLLWCKEAVRN